MNRLNNGTWVNYQRGEKRWQVMLRSNILCGSTDTTVNTREVEEQQQQEQQQEEEQEGEDNPLSGSLRHCVSWDVTGASYSVTSLLRLHFPSRLKLQGTGAAARSLSFGCWTSRYVSFIRDFTIGSSWTHCDRWAITSQWWFFAVILFGHLKKAWLHFQSKLTVAADSLRDAKTLIAKHFKNKIK